MADILADSYITTAIPYVNAAPHLGYALELVQADVLARHRRRRGGRARLLTGTDDNAFKNVTAARAAGVDVQIFVDGNAARFAALAAPLQAGIDDFLRTSTDPRHTTTVHRLWRESAARGDFYQRSYQGLYCPGCEQFYAPGELDDGRCREHGRTAEVVEETNWFFRLSRYQDRLIDVIEGGLVRIEPVQRRNEVLAFLRGGLDDISVSRPAQRSGGWGIPVPDDPGQVIYVWWDALANYVSALDFAADSAEYQQWWAASGERIHIIGKGIVRFHAVYWLALLLSAGLRLPTTLLVHDYITTSGKKISKSDGNDADPADLIARFGADAVRWWLLADVAHVGDTDFTVTRLLDRANTDLVNGLGNLAQRIAGLNRRGGPAGRTAASPDGILTDLPKRIDAALDHGDFRGATQAIREAGEELDRLISHEKPWRLDPASPEFGDLVARLNAAVAVLAAELEPFLPEAAARIAAVVNGHDIAGPVFARLSHPGEIVAG
jgi:methionyl-tRNA synthetase